MDKVRSWLQSHPASYLIAVALVCICLMNLFPGTTTDGLILQSIVLAVGSSLLLFCFDEVSLGRTSKKDARFVGRKSLYLLLIALTAGVTLYVNFQNNQDGFSSGWQAQLLFLLIICLCTGVFEESLFRGVIFQVVESGFGEGKHSLLKAAIVSSLLFGIFHVSATMHMAGLDNPFVIGQIILKPLQAAIFGFYMTALFSRVKNIWLLALVHGLNNFFLMMPLAFWSDSLVMDYLSGNPFDFVLLAIQVVLYIPLIFVALNIFKQAEHS